MPALVGRVPAAMLFADSSSLVDPGFVITPDVAQVDKGATASSVFLDSNNLARSLIESPANGSVACLSLPASASNLSFANYVDQGGYGAPQFDPVANTLIFLRR